MSVKGFTFKLATKGPWSSVIKDQVRAHSKYNLAKTSGHYVAVPALRADSGKCSGRRAANKGK